MGVMTLIQVILGAVHAVTAKSNGFTCQLLLAADTAGCQGRLYVQAIVTPHCTSGG